MRHRVLLVCLLVSGACALAYELLWTRLLSLAFGSTTQSLSTVLAVFFGGLALGAWVAGRRPPARPLRAYGLIEIATGLGAVLLLPLLGSVDDLVAAIDPRPGVAGAFVRLAVSAPLLVVPTVLMGATLPIVVNAVVRRDGAAGRGTALVYGVNTIGAALGAYATTYHLLPALGVTGSVLFAAAANLLVGFTALTLDRRASATPDEAPATAAPRAERSPRALVVAATLATFLAGFAFIGYEVVWARLVSSILEGTIYGVGAVLICFLAGIGLGSMVLARREPRRAAFGLWFAGLQAVTVIFVALLWHGLPHLAQALKLAGTPHVQLLVVAAALVVPAACSGASFPLLVRLVETRARCTGRALGSLYAANTVGSILGAVVAGFMILPLLGSVGAMTVATGCVAAVGAIVGVAAGEGRRRLLAPAIVTGAVALVLLGGGFPAQSLAIALAPMRSAPGTWVLRQPVLPPILYFGEGINATVAVYEVGASRTMYINGLPQGARRDLPPRISPEAVLTALIPLAHVPETTRALVVGLGTGMTVESLQRLGVGQITVCELEQRVVEAVEAVYPQGSPLDVEGVTVELNDARHTLLRNAGKRDRTYDVITSMPFHPWAASHLFTREFFELAAANLSPHGVFSTWVGLSRFDEASLESILRAFSAVFPNYVVYDVPRTGALFLVGSAEPLMFDLAHLASLGKQPILRGFTGFDDPFFLPACVHASGDAGTPPPPEGPVNSDDSVYVEVNVARGASRGVLRAGFLRREYLLPSAVPEPQRRALYLGLLERLVGTPGGRIPPRRMELRLDRARRTIGALADILDEGDLSYFAGRVALEEGWTAEARRLLGLAGAAGGEVARRAAKFKAMCEPPGSVERLEQLAALVCEPDVVMEALEIDRERALSMVSAAPVPEYDDPLGWFLHRAATVRPGELSDEDRAFFVREVGGALVGSDRPGLLSELERFARGQGLERIAAIFAARLGAATDVSFERRLRAGLDAARAGRHDAALESLWAATALDPLDERAVKPLLRALAVTGDSTRASGYLDELRCRGRSQDEVVALWEAAQGLGTESRTASVLPER